jgi:hypothetical protein
MITYDMSTMQVIKISKYNQGVTKKQITRSEMHDRVLKLKRIQQTHDSEAGERMPADLAGINLQSFLQEMDPD